ncbi:uncharacterized protein LOC143534380 isoform X2 [Bidens hawaiensis]|uniref:uncharacterized protein LOC143534380 isoform X2 n=1 Tax=Bidens hawaiensis TaxID=980011 RepID=UPI00404ACFD7
MVSGSRIEGTHNLSAGVRRTIQSIKEIVGNHSDADIYTTLKETNMDPNETTQKLLNQDPFHEVKRKRDKKKEVTSFKAPAPVIRSRKPTEQQVQVKPAEQPVQGAKPNTYSDRRPFQRAGFVRNNVSDAGRTRQFRVVRDNRNNQNETKPPVKSSVNVTTKQPPVSTTPEKSSAEASKTQKSNVNPSSIDSLSKQVKGVSLAASGRRPVVSNVTPPVHVATKPHDSVTSPNSSVIGVYSSSSDPVHIPSLASRPPANVGAIKREIGPVGVRRHPISENPAKPSSAQAAPVSNSKDHFKSFPAVSKTDQHTQSGVVESVPSGRSFNNQHGNRSHQPFVTHHKVPQANKEWKPKPKPAQKPSVTEVGVIGTPKKPTPSPAKIPKELTFGSFVVESDSTPKQEDQNVIIAAHISVSEADRKRLTFGNLGVDSDLPQNSGFQEATRVDESHVEPLARLSVSSTESSIDKSSESKHAELVDEQPSSGSVSSGSGVLESQWTDRVESSSPQNMENYTNIDMVRHSSPSYAPSETHQQQSSSELPSFSAYDPQTGYDMSYFRPASDESLRGQVLQIPQEGFSSHVANSIPATTIPMVQQQAPVAAQMYPPVHLPHFTNIMPYRQFLSPVYVPPMVMPGYSNNPTYSPHPSTGSSYLMMAGANSPHVSANGMKYAIPQYRSVQAGSPTGFGNFTSPTGYALNTPGVVGSASGLDKSSRLKYKDVNVYIPNPQAETSEVWMNPREMPSMQSASYYNMAGQSPYHTGHGSFNAQSSHMQFPGLYHPPQPAAVANPLHMGGNVGAGAPGAQVGYQQTQLNWSGNF